MHGHVYMYVYLFVIPLAEKQLIKGTRSSLSLARQVVSKVGPLREFNKKKNEGVLKFDLICTF